MKKGSMACGQRLQTVVLFGVVGLALGTLRCSDAITIEVVMLNSSSGLEAQDIHILVPGEGFAPSNRLTPGARRVKKVGYVPAFTPGASEGVEFRAGRNGQVITTVLCVSERPELVSQANVTWDSSSLRCSNWDGG